MEIIIYLLLGATLGLVFGLFIGKNSSRHHDINGIPKMTKLRDDIFLLKEEMRRHEKILNDLEKEKRSMYITQRFFAMNLKEQSVADMLSLLNRNIKELAKMLDIKIV